MIEIEIKDGTKLVFEDNGEVKSNSDKVNEIVDCDNNGKKIDIKIEG